MFNELQYSEFIFGKGINPRKQTALEVIEAAVGFEPTNKGIAEDQLHIICCC